MSVTGSVESMNGHFYKVVLFPRHETCRHCGSPRLGFLNPCHGLEEIKIKSRILRRHTVSIHPLSVYDHEIQSLFGFKMDKQSKTTSSGHNCAVVDLSLPGKFNCTHIPFLKKKVQVLVQSNCHTW